MQRTNTQVYLLALLVIVCLALLSFHRFNTDIKANRLNEEYIQMSEVADMCADYVTDRFNIYMAIVQTASEQISIPGSLKDPSVIRLIEQVRQETDFVAMSVTFPDGDSATTYQGAYSSQFASFTDTTKSIKLKTYNNTNYFVFSVPIFEKGRLAAQVRALLPVDVIRKSMVGLNIFGGEGYLRLTAGNGDFLFESEHKNVVYPKSNTSIFSSFPGIELSNGYDAYRIRREMTERREMFFTATTGDAANSRLIFLKPLDIEDWYLCVLIPESYISDRTSSVKMDVLILILAMTAIFLMLIAYILIKERRMGMAFSAANKLTDGLISNIPGGVLRCDTDERLTMTYVSSGFSEMLGMTMEELINTCHGSFWETIAAEERETVKSSILAQLEEKRSFEAVYRMRRKDGNVIYALDKGGIVRSDEGGEYVCCVLVDITQTQKTVEELRASEERYKIVTSQADVLIFEYDAVNNVIHNSEGILRKFGLPILIKNATETGVGIPGGENEPEQFKRLLSLLTPSNKSVSSRYYFEAPNERRYYIETHLTGVFNNDGRLINAIGAIEDLTEQKDTEIKYLQAQKFRETLSKLYDREYEFDLSNDRLLSGKSTRAASYVAKLYAAHVHPNDRELFLSFFSLKRAEEYIKNGQAELDIEYRLSANLNGEYRWKAAHITLYSDPKDNSIRMICFVKDTNDEKNRTAVLIEKAEKDPLTGLYNKANAEAQITLKIEENSSMTPDRRCALLIMDLDNFKNVNDRMGHLFGDAVLTEAAKRLRDIFRSTDIIGRIGGDEFMVLMTDLPNIQVAVKKAEDACAAMRNIHKGEDGDLTVSASIGIAFSPEDGTSFAELYNKADIALYRAKDAGKAKVTVYDSKMGEVFDSARTFIPLIENCDVEQGTFADNPPLYTFKILYSATDTNAALRGVIELVMRHFNFTRGYIFENSDDNKYYSMTLEVCSEGLDPYAENLRNCCYETTRPNYHLQFNEEGIYLMDIKTAPEHLRKIFEAQNITYLIQVAMMKNGVFSGFIGFDYCDENTLSPEKVKTIALVTQVIAFFVQKEKEDGRTEGNAALQ